MPPLPEHATHALLGLLNDVSDELHRLNDALRGRDTSVFGGGRTVAPVAGQVIASTDVIPAPGLYEVEVWTGANGGAPAELGNFEVRAGDRLLVDGLGGDAPALSLRMFVKLDGETDLDVRATAAGTVGVAYAAAIVATRVK
jgi:hypothetical protein